MPKTKQHFNAEGTHVFLVHADAPTGWWAPVGVAQDFVDGKDWVYAEPVDTSFQDLFDQSTAEGAAQTGFNPADHTVADVNAHLEEMHAAGADGEVARVLALEFAEAGRGRVSVKDPRPSLDGDEDEDSTDPNADDTTNG